MALAHLHDAGVGMANNVFGTCAKINVATLAHVVNVREHRFNVTLLEYVATLAHVVSVGEHRLDVTLIKYVATFALL